jgi:hypothetical protein
MTIDPLYEAPQTPPCACDVTRETGLRIERTTVGMADFGQ